MKKLLIVYILISNYFSIHAQTFIDSMTVDVCKCIENELDFDFDDYLNCMKSSSDKYIMESMVLMDSSSTLSPSEQGEIIGQKMFMLVQNNLVYQCDSFFQFSLDIHEWSFQKLKAENSTIDKAKIDSIKLLSSTYPSSENLFESGIFYFTEGDINQAEKDFLKSIEINKNYAPPYMFLRWLYKRINKYTESIYYYEKCIEIIGGNDLSFFLEPIKRLEKDE